MSTIQHLSRVILVGWLFAGCTVRLLGSPGPTTAAPPAGTAEPTETPVSEAPARPHSGGRAELVAWARQATDTGVACPMSAEDAEQLSKTNGPEGELAAAIGCMCSVELTCDGYRRASCPLVEPSARLAIHHVGQSERDADDDRVIAAWEDRLYATRNAPLAKISRATPLPPATRAAYLATVDQRPYIAQIEDDNRQMADVIAKKLWGTLQTYQGHAHAVLADLQKRTCGAHNSEASALVAKIDATFAAHRKEIANSERVQRRMDADPVLRRLENERDSLEKRLAELEHAHGRAADVCSESGRAGWQICRVAARVDEVNHQINRRIDVVAAGG